MKALPLCIVLCFIGFGIGSLSFPANAQEKKTTGAPSTPEQAARDKANEIVCVSNLRQIGLGCLMYAQDYKETFPPKAQNYKKAIMPYLKNEQVFHCPLDKSGVVSYSFNSSLAGVNLNKIKAPAQTVLLYEGKDGKLNFRHGGKAGVVLADGHGKMVTKEQAKSFLWKP